VRGDGNRHMKQLQGNQKFAAMPTEKRDSILKFIGYQLLDQTGIFSVSPRATTIVSKGKGLNIH